MFSFLPVLFPIFVCRLFLCAEAFDGFLFFGNSFESRQNPMDLQCPSYRAIVFLGGIAYPHVRDLNDP